MLRDVTKVIFTQTTSRLAVIGVATLVVGACGQESVSEQKGFSANSQASNVAVLMSGSGEGHIPKNVAMIRDVISDPGAGYNFQVVEQQRVTAEQAVAVTSRAAAQVSADGTLFWYFSSHGAKNGTLQTYSGMLNFEKVSAGILAARGGRPLKRLVVVVQACYSGQLVNGSAAIGGGSNPFSNLGLRSGFSLAGAESQGLIDAQNLRTYTDQLLGQRGARSGAIAEQLLVMSAAMHSEMSMYSSDGSHFTKALYNTFKESRGNSSLTMFDFLKKVQSRVGTSTPQFRAVPEQQVLSEPLYRTMTANEAGFAAATTANSVQNIALWINGAPNASNVYVSSAPETARMVVCQGNAAVCAQATAAKMAIPIVGKSATGNRAVFGASWNPKANGVYTLQAINAAGQIVGQRTISFRPKS